MAGMTTSTATVLCAELDVSTGPVEDELRRDRMATLHDVVKAHRGAVVTGIGRVFTATFAAAADGVAAARAIQQTVDLQVQATRGRGPLMRLGLSVGDVAFEGARCDGAPVVEAAGLCAHADGGQILATDLLRVLGRSQEDPGFEELGPRPLPGLPVPVDVVEIRWTPLEPWSTPLPAQLADTAPELVGRRSELEELDDAYRGVAASGRRAVVLVSGEPGVGKTTMVAHAVRAWHGEGARIGVGACDEYLRTPYRPFMDALGRLVLHAPTELLEAHVARHGAGLLPLVRELAWRLPELPAPVSTDPEAERFLLFSAAGDLLVRLSEAGPLVVFLDDLHWADAASASLLRSIAEDGDRASLLVVGTFRDAELVGDHTMARAIAAFRRVPAVTRVHLGGLRRPDVARLVERWTGRDDHPGAEELVASLTEETGGNAFFVVEVLRHLAETGQLAEGGPVAKQLMPESVREVLAERVARLGQDASDVIGAAAVIGAEFSLPVLSAVTGVADGKVLEALADAISAALVRELPDDPGRFSFTHALVQHAILANLGTTREVRLHRRAAEVLEKMTGGEQQAVQLAHHWLQATRHSDTARARDWARQAGDGALASLAPADAVGYYRQALALHDQTGNAEQAMRIDLLTSLGTAQRLAGEPAHRETLLEAGRLAREAGDGPRLTAAALANNSGTFSQFGGVDEERVESLRQAANLAPSAAQRALVLGTLANELTYSGDYAERRAIVDEATSLARASGDHLLMLRVCNHVFYPLWIPDTLAERLTITEECLNLLADVDDPLVRFWTFMAGYLNLVQAGRIAESDQLLDAVVELADRLAQPALQWRARHTEATRLLLRGDVDGAERLASEARQLGLAAGEPVADVYFKSQSLCVHWQRGTMADLAGRISGARPRPPNATAALCLIFAEGGRADEARSLLAAEAARSFSTLRPDPAYLTALAFFSESAMVLGDPTAAEPLYRLLAPFVGQVGFDGVTTVGLLEHHVGGLAGLLGRRDEAIERLERSRDGHASIGAPFFEARSRAQLAQS